MVNQNHYRIQAIGQIDTRYYLVRIHNQEYILDYANPRDVRTYLSGLFPKFNTEYSLYGFDDKLKDDISAVALYSTFTGSIVENISGLFLILLFILPKSINPIAWFYNKTILQNWYIYLLFILIGLVGIITFLIMKTKKVEPYIHKNNVLIIKRVEPLKKQRFAFPQKASDFLGYLLGIPICLLFGIITSNYLLLLISGFIAFYQLIFFRFTNFSSNTRKYKYSIIESENKE